MQSKCHADEMSSVIENVWNSAWHLGSFQQMIAFIWLILLLLLLLPQTTKGQLGEQICIISGTC